jgi:hypothetical protein
MLAFAFFIGPAAGFNVLRDFTNALQFDNTNRNVPLESRAPMLMAFYDAATAEQVFAETKMNYPSPKGPSGMMGMLRGKKPGAEFLDYRSALLTGAYNVER